MDATIDYIESSDKSDNRRKPANHGEETTNDSFITIVSGLPRSGTSMIMNMLRAGGMALVTDHLRTPDEDNPRGYFEFEPVKDLAADQSWLPDARGKAIKVISQLLYELPDTESYRIVFIHRDMDEILTSQRKMLIRRGIDKPGISDRILAAKFHEHLDKVADWIAGQKHIRCMTVEYGDVVTNPVRAADGLADFLEIALDRKAMAAAVDPVLYRNRGLSP